MRNIVVSPLADVAHFWTRYVHSSGPYPFEPRHVRARVAALSPYAPPGEFVALTTAGHVTSVSAPAFKVEAVGDWLGYSLARHQMMTALSRTHDNPLLAFMLPFGDTPGGFEVALDLRDGAVVWLDPARYDSGVEARVTVLAPTLSRWIEHPVASPALRHEGR